MTKAKPFIKWAGGKRNLIEKISPYFPSKFNCYYEPFLGGGAVYFSIENLIQHAVLSDNNSELIITYQVIKNEPDRLIKKLKKLASNHSKEQYYLIRAKNPKNNLEVAARFLYLNKTCYNGLYRVNSLGKFNVPIGKYKEPNIVQEERILTCHKILEKAEIVCNDFEKIKPKKRDFVYLDPPYHPIDETSFTKYTKDNFTKKDQLRLAKLIKKLSKEGVYVMLSNSKTKFIEELYPKKYFKHKIVYAPRFVNCKPDKRGNIEELLITNY